MNKRASLNERDVRFERIRAAMEQKRLDALVVAGHASHFNRGYIRYFADTHLWAGDALLLIPLRGESVHVQVTYAGSAWPEELWIADVRRVPHPEDEIVKAMVEKGLTKGKVGIAGLNRVITVGAYETLKNSLPDVEFVNADLMTDRVCAIKSPLELQQYRELWKVSQAAMERFVKVVGPGKTEREVAAEAGKVIRAGGSFDDLTLIHEGEYRGLPRDVPLKCNDLVGLHLEICGESGHWSEIDVTCAFREPTELELKLMDSELVAYDEILKMARPGVRLSDMADTFERVLVEDGWEFGEPGWHYYFHGHGMDDIEWPWYSAMLEDNQDAVLEEGMVLCYHPHRDTIPAVAWGPNICDDIVITAHGAERLSGDWNLRWRVVR